MSYGKHAEYKEKHATKLMFEENSRKRFGYMANSEPDRKARERWAKAVFGKRWKEELDIRDRKAEVNNAQII